MKDDAVCLRDCVAPPVSPTVNNWQRRGSSGNESASATSTTTADPVTQPKTPMSPMIANSDIMKQRVREALRKPEYNVANFYHETGIWRSIATNPVFENLTLMVISINALWIAIDTDGNPASTLLDAQPIFQVAEHLFCWYFSFEWYVRFSSFRRKQDGLKDGWFVFDSCLVFMMVAETWVMTSILMLGSGGGSGMGGASILRLFRLLRLSRLARMLRSMPELMILIKGMLAASRSVFFTMCLLVILLYLFAIMLRQLTDGTPVGDAFFYSVPASMYKLLIEGVFLDNLGDTAETIAATSPVYAAVFFVFVVCAALMVMNMLIGVLCEVVSAVAATEKEEMNVLALRSKLAEVMLKLDTSGNGRLSQEEFVQLVSDTQAVKLLDEMGIDPISLIDMAPTIFEPREDDSDDDSDDGVERLDSSKGCEIDFQEFMKVVLDLRGSNAASLKDLRELKQDLVHEIESLKVKLNLSRRRSNTRISSLRSCGSQNSTTVGPLVLDPPPPQPRSETPLIPVGMAAPRSPRGAEVPPLPPGSMQCEDVCSVCSTSTRGAASPEPSQGEARDDVDMLEVEKTLRALQAALLKVQRSDAPRVARTGNEKNMLDWADSMSKMATSELEKLQRMQQS